MKDQIIIGTRGSKLALWQAEYTKAKLAAAGISAVLKIIKTKGDKIQHLSFDKIEGKGFFTKEIEDALLNGEIDMAVHSMKDLPTTQPDGLRLAAVSYRQNPADLLIINPAAFDKTQPLKIKKNAIVGTSSARRKAQLLSMREDFQIKDIRGNVPTRIQKLRDGQFDAIMLAAAGVERLELVLEPEFVTLELDPTIFIPAPAQGVLAFQIRSSDKALSKELRILHDQEVVECTNVERRVLQMCDGGCHVPLGVYCKKDSIGNFHVWAAKAKHWDGTVNRVRFSSSIAKNLSDTVFNALMKEEEQNA